MTRRDLAWRGGGLILFALASAISLADVPGTNGGLGLLWFALALAGLVLVIQGRRVAAALRVERSRHRALAQAVHERRRGGSRGRNG